MKILISDHDAGSRDFLQRSLQAWGYETEIAADQAGIWNGLMQSGAPVMAIVDCDGPGLAGLDVFRNIRGTIKDHNVYLILLSSRADPAYTDEALEAGANDYLHRPLSEAELRTRVDSGRRLLELEDALTRRSSRDALTGLHNRDAILEHLRKEMVRCQRERSALSIVFTDLDHLEQTNQRHGHLVGDAVLQEVSRRLHGALRPYDHLGRSGSDELLMILPACNTAGALEVAERARMAVATATIDTEAGALLATITSVTATLTGNKSVSPELLLQLAETAMYRAKEKGRNQVGLANLYCSIL